MLVDRNLHVKLHHDFVVFFPFHFWGMSRWMVEWAVSMCGKRYDELSTWTSPDIRRFASLHCRFYCCEINYEYWVGLNWKIMTKKSTMLWASIILGHHTVIIIPKWDKQAAVSSTSYWDSKEISAGENKIKIVLQFRADFSVVFCWVILLTYRFSPSR